MRINSANAAFQNGHAMAFELPVKKSRSAIPRANQTSVHFEPFRAEVCSKVAHTRDWKFVDCSLCPRRTMPMRRKDYRILQLRRASVALRVHLPPTGDNQ